MVKNFLTLMKVIIVSESRSKSKHVVILEKCGPVDVFIEARCLSSFSLSEEINKSELLTGFVRIICNRKVN